MLIQENLSIQEKLAILTDAAKYDVSCTSSGVSRRGRQGSLGKRGSGRHLPQFCGGRPVHFPVKDFVYESVYLRLPVLCKPLFK